MSRLTGAVLTVYFTVLTLVGVMQAILAAQAMLVGELGWSVFFGMSVAGSYLLIGNGVEYIRERDGK